MTQHGDAERFTNLRFFNSNALRSHIRLNALRHNTPAHNFLYRPHAATSQQRIQRCSNRVDKFCTRDYAEHRNQQRSTLMFRRIGNAAGFGSAAAPASESEQGNPLELISFNAATKKFELGIEALDVLRKITGPVAVVAVSGRARQGKSFILNQLLGRSTGFVVGPTVRPCTKAPPYPTRSRTLPFPDTPDSYSICKRAVHAYRTLLTSLAHVVVSRGYGCGPRPSNGKRQMVAPIISSFWTQRVLTPTTRQGMSDTVAIASCSSQ